MSAITQALLMIEGGGAMPASDLLLHFEEGPSQPVVDSSANGITFTKFGDWNQNVYSAKWGTYGCFTSGGRAVSASNPILAPGSGDFIYDFWLRQANGINFFPRCVFDTKYTGGGGGTGFQLYASMPGVGYDYRLTLKNNAGTLYPSPAANISDNVLYFVAIARISGVIYVQLNSSVVISFADTTNFTNTVLCLNDDSTGGNIFNGGVDEFHYIKGWAPASMPMAVPTAPY